MSTRDENIAAMLTLFRAIEERGQDAASRRRERELMQPDVEFHWPPSLPYGGSSRGAEREGPTWSDTWDALQPTPAERRFDPRVVAANDDEVVILYRQRGKSATGERYDGEVLGLYRLREGKLARAQMFYFDEAEAVRFLAGATGRGSPGQGSQE
jgi:ketosteroid isomerase-like protein